MFPQVTDGSSLRCCLSLVREENFGAQPRFEQLPETLGHIKDEIFFH